MSDSDTGETFRFSFQNKTLSQLQTLTVLPTAAITTRMLVTAKIMRIRPCLLLQHKKLTNTKREKIKGKENHQNFNMTFKEFFLFR